MDNIAFYKETTERIVNAYEAISMSMEKLTSCWPSIRLK